MKKFGNKILKWVFEVVLRKKLGLKSGPVGPNIEWHESETIISGIVVSAYGLYSFARIVGQTYFGYELPEVPDTWLKVAAGVLGPTVVWGRWTSDKKID